MSTTLAPVDLWPGRAPGAQNDGPEDRPMVQVVQPEGAGPFPAMVVCAGGGYHFRSDHEGLPIARWLASIGIAGVVVSYRIAPYRHPIPLTDARRAIRLTRARAKAWKIDPDRVGIIGFSAGGHLAASAAILLDEPTLPCDDQIEKLDGRPDLTVLCYPVITGGEHRHHGSFKNLLGDDRLGGPRALLSLETRVTPRTPPTFLWHTSDDPVVPVQNSLLLAGALAQARIPFSCHVYPNGGHGMGLAEGSASVAWTTECRTWFRHLGWIG